MEFKKIVMGGVAVGAMSTLLPGQAIFAGNNQNLVGGNILGNEGMRNNKIVSSSEGDRPNIILIMTDQHTAGALSCVGNKNVNTPNIDRIASHGYIFNNAYCTAPLSGPSRASMFTGLYPDEIGVIRNGAPLPDSLINRTLGTILTDAGYECAYAGKWHVHEATIPDKKYGFTRIFEHSDIGLAEASVNYLRKEHEKPFFCVISYDNPHNICEWARNQNLPYGNIEQVPISKCPKLPRNFKRNSDDADVILTEKKANYSAYPTIRFTRKDWRQYMYTYYRLVEKVDAEIGKVVDELDRQNLWENSIIIFTSDHGDGVASHQWNQKSSLYEEVVNIPLLISLPEQQASNAQKTQLVSNGVDLFATIVDIAGAELPSYAVGESILPVFESNGNVASKANTGNGEIHDFIVTETCFDKGTARGWMLRTPKYKYVLYDKGKNREQFFDIENDKLERHNLAKKKEYKEELNRHRDLLAKWMKDNKVRPTRDILDDVPGKPSNLNNRKPK